MKRLFHVPAGASAAVEVDPGRLPEVRGDGWVWLSLVEFDHEELIDVGATFELDRFALEEVARTTKYPKVESYGSYTFVVGHGLQEEGGRVSTVEYDAFIGADFLVTFEMQELPGFNWGRQHAILHEALDGIGPDRLFSRIADAGSFQFQPLLDALETRLVELEERAVEGDPFVPSEVQSVRRDVLVLRGTTAAQRDAYRTLSREGMAAIGDRASLRLSAVYDHFFRLTEEVDGTRSLLSGVLDTYRGAVAEKANEVMKVLTVFAAIVLPLSLMAGIYGMNFANMPELKWRWAYFGLLGLMTVVALGLWAYFGRRGFIGGPRLQRIPRGVGRGLAGLANITVVPTLRILRVRKRDDE